MNLGDGLVRRNRVPSSVLNVSQHVLVFHCADLYAINGISCVRCCPTV